MTLHILTLHWNKKNNIKNLYESLLPNLKDIDWKWHIKDNCSNDGSIEEIEGWNNSNINLIKYSHNKDNYSQGMNFLFDQANPKNDDLILTMNNDLLFRDSQSIKNMIELLQKDKNIGLIGAKLNYPTSNKIQHCGVLFHKFNGLPFHFRSGSNEEYRDRIDRYYPAVTGALSLTTGDIFRNSRFNEKLFWQFDDIYFNMVVKHRLKKDIVYCGRTNITHEESSSLKTNPVHKMFQKHNVNLFLIDWHKYIDVNINDKYQDNKFNLYKG